MMYSRSHVHMDKERLFIAGKRQVTLSVDDEEEQDKRQAAIEIVAELQLTAEQLKVSCALHWREIARVGRARACPFPA